MPDSAVTKFALSLVINAIAGVRIMAIFSRRILQRIINENARILSDGQLRSHIKRLNRMHKTLELGDEWEVVLLNAFSKVGRVTHEEGIQ